jgi:hypothetical protein
MKGRTVQHGGVSAKLHKHPMPGPTLLTCTWLSWAFRCLNGLKAKDAKGNSLSTKSYQRIWESRAAGLAAWVGDKADTKLSKWDQVSQCEKNEGLAERSGGVNRVTTGTSFNMMILYHCVMLLHSVSYRILVGYQRCHAWRYERK